MSGYGVYNAFSWPRLLLVPCYLLLGRLGDVMHGRYVSAVTVFGIFAILLIPVLIGKRNAYWSNLYIFYIAIQRKGDGEKWYGIELYEDASASGEQPQYLGVQDNGSAFNIWMLEWNNDRSRH